MQWNIEPGRPRGLDHDDDDDDDNMTEQEGLGRTNCLLPLTWHGPHRKWRIQQFFYCCVCVFVTAVKFLPSRCLAMLGGYTYRHTDWWEIFFIKTGLRCHDICTKFHKDWFRHSKLNGGIHRCTDTYTNNKVISQAYFYFFHNKGRILQTVSKPIVC
jgi:hypothetical protein